MKRLGNVLPTRESFDCSAEYARREKENKMRIAKKELKGLEPIESDWETRYYKADTIYAVIGRDNKVHWFEVREDGDYRS